MRASAHTRRGREPHRYCRTCGGFFLAIDVNDDGDCLSCVDQIDLFDPSPYIDRACRKGWH